MTRSTEKRLNEMDRLEDMLHFPAVVNAGATFNVVVTLLASWWVAPRYPLMAGVWVALVLAVNLLPVVLLRTKMNAATVYPRLAEMNFIRDQHKFSNWVYVAASANMAFWVLLGWTVALQHRTRGSLLMLEVVAVLVTFCPVMIRSLRNRN